MTSINNWARWASIRNLSTDAMESQSEPPVSLRCAFCHQLATAVEITFELNAGEEKAGSECFSESSSEIAEQLWSSHEHESAAVLDQEQHAQEIDIEGVKR